MKRWKKFLAAVTAGVLCVGSVGVSGAQQTYAKMALVPDKEDVVDGDIPLVGSDCTVEINRKKITLAELRKSSYNVTLDISVNIDVNSFSFGVYMNDGLKYNRMYNTSIGDMLPACNDDKTFVFVPFAYRSASMQAMKAGKFAEISVKVPETAKAGDIFELQVCGKDARGNSCSWSNIETGDVGYVSGSTNYISIMETPTKTYGDLRYVVTDTGEVEIFGWDADDAINGHVEIPEEIDGKPVTSIGAYAFYNCTDLTEITIPDSVTNIGQYAFYGCINLTEITVPDSVENIEDCTFYGCTSLLKVTMPDSVTSVGEQAFYGCVNLNEVTIPSSINVDNHKDFFSDIGSGSRNLKIITYDNANLKRNCVYDDYNSDEHENCSVFVATNVTSLEVKPKEGKILTGAYQSCCHLKEVTLEEGITLIEDDAFANCDNLEKIVIPRSVTGIRYTAFTYDTKLTMYGYKDTYAEKYAEMFGFPFVALDDSDTPPVTTTTTPTGSEESPIYGDINLDGRIDITDAVLLNKYCAGSIEMNADALQNADCDGDKEIGNNDAIVLLKFLVQLVPTLPYSE